MTDSSTSQKPTSAKPLWLACYHHFGFWLATFGSWIVFWGACRVRVVGRENIPGGHGPVLFVGNHISHFDPPALTVALWRRITWIVALDMYAHPVGAFFFNGIGAIPVDRESADMRATREALRQLREGRRVGLFPEAGIRSGEASVLGGALLDESVGALALLGSGPAGSVQIVPCLVLGTDKLYAKRAWAWRRTTLYFSIGEPIDVREFVKKNGLAKSEARGALSRAVEESLRHQGAELRKRYGLTDDDFPKTAQERWADAEHEQPRS